MHRSKNINYRDNRLPKDIEYKNLIHKYFDFFYLLVYPTLNKFNS